MNFIDDSTVLANVLQVLGQFSIKNIDEAFVGPFPTEKNISLVRMSMLAGKKLHLWTT